MRKAGPDRRREFRKQGSAKRAARKLPVGPLRPLAVVFVLAATLSATHPIPDMTRRERVDGSPFAPIETLRRPARAAGQAATTNPVLESDRLDAVGKSEIAVVLALKGADGDAVWPGFAAAGIPIILYNARFEFLTGAPELPPGWTIVEGDAAGGIPYGRRLAKNPQAFAVKAGEVWAGSCPTLVLMNAKGPFRFGRDFHAVMILHEMFHAYEAGQAPAKFKAAMDAYKSETRYPFADKEFAAGWAEEGSLLAEALKAPDDAACVRAARKFLEVRRSRRARAGLDAGTLAFERELEWLEGLAEYAEIRFYELAGRHESEGWEIRFAPRLPFLLQNDFARLGKRLASDKGDLRFYVSGMAQARLLDRLAPDWKTKAPIAEVDFEGLIDKATASPAR